MQYAFSAAEDGLRPVRIGAVAVQPAPDSIDVLYIGLAGLLPSDLQVHYSCAGLFFGRVVVQDQEQVHLETAAFSHYFHGDVATRERHVRRMTLSRAMFVQLLEWDRRLAGMATCDVREVVEEHAARAARLQRAGELSSLPDVPLETASVPPSPEQHYGVAEATGGRSLVPQMKRDARQSTLKRHTLVFERETVVVPLHAIRDLVAAPNATERVSPGCLDRLALQAALQQTCRERQAEKNERERRALKTKERRLRRIRRLRGRMKGAKLIEVTPIFERRKIVSCRVDVDVPMLVAA